MPGTNILANLAHLLVTKKKVVWLRPQGSRKGHIDTVHESTAEAEAEDKAKTHL